MKRYILILIVFILSIGTLSSKDFTIIFVKKEFDLGVKGKELTKDYYTNIGAVQGVLKGTSLDVYRKIKVIDSQNGGLPIEVKLFVGQLEAIFVNLDITIARVANFSNSENNPVLEYNSFMVGDLVEIGKPKGKKTAMFKVEDLLNAKKMTRTAQTFIGYLMEPFISNKEGLILDLYKL